MSLQDNIHILKNTKIGIFEYGISDIKFILSEISKYLKIDIISFYERKEYYKNNVLFSITDIDEEDNLENYNNLIKEYVNNIMELRNKDNILVVDDMYTYNSFIGEIDSDGIFIYRSDSFCSKDFYSYDYIIELIPPKSGLSNVLDGYIVIRNREEIVYKTKYKIERDNIKYFL